MSFFNINNIDAPSAWNAREKWLLRFFFVFFLLQVLPLDWKLYRQLFFSETSFFFSLFSIAKYYPYFISDSVLNWLLIIAAAMAGAFVWGMLDKDGSDARYNKWYQYLRVLLRFRLAIAVIGYGLVKLFPLQMPYPSLSNLHTNYGDFLPWKIYFHTLGITPGFERFLGGAEIFAGVLLLFRKTTTFGAGIIVGFTGNVVAANLAYHIGEGAFSLFIVLMALFLFAYDAPRLYNLLIRQKYTPAAGFNLRLSSREIAAGKLLKSAAIVFISVEAFATYHNYQAAPYNIPQTTGLKKAYGYYNVREFKFNNQLIPYTVTDTNRWQNVVFEKWATISIKTARPIRLDLSLPDAYHANDIDRNYESAGVGGRRYFSYSIDEARQQLQLKNKNPHHHEETFDLKYTWINDSTIALRGVNERQDSIYALLDRINKKYLLFEGRRKRVKL